MVITTFKAQTTKIDYYKPVTKTHGVLLLPLSWFLDVKEFDAVTLKILSKRRYNAKWKSWLKTLSKTVIWNV